MQLTPGTTINRGDTVTRQTLYNLLYNASGGTVEQSDLGSTVLDIMCQSEPPTAKAGRLWWDQTDQLMKLYVDVLDDTGVSCWISIGPDRWDMPMLTTEPIPFGAAVQLVGDGRKVKLPPAGSAILALGRGLAPWESAKVVGFNNNGPRLEHATADSGAWISVATDGLVWCWYPANYGVATRLASAGTGILDDLINRTANITNASGITDTRGGVIQGYLDGVGAIGPANANRGAYLVQSIQSLAAGTGASDCSQAFWARQMFSGARITRAV